MFLAVGACALAALGAGTAAAQATIEAGCMQEAAGFALGCTANDVAIAGVATLPDGSPDLEILDDGCAFPGDEVTFTATFDVVLTAQARHDIGVYFATDGDPNQDGAVGGSCTVSTVAFAPDPPWLDLDHLGDGGHCSNAPSRFCTSNRDCRPGQCIFEQDTCGDIDDSHNPLHPRITLTTRCIDPNENGTLNLPNCTSWRQPGANSLCTDPLDAYPGAPSKCRCDLGFEIPIEVPAATLEVTKTAEPTSVPEPGGTVTFRVSVKNTSVDPSNSVDLDTLSDDVYGNLLDPANPKVRNNDCTGLDGENLAANETVSCQFDVALSGNAGDEERDVVTASGLDQRTPANRVSGEDDATVTLSDVLPSLSVRKGAVPTQIAEPGGTVTFGVTLVNTSVSGDPVTITSLTDDVHGDLNGKGNCSVPRTLAGNGGSYACYFTAQVQGNSGYSETDVVTASGADDEGNPVQGSDSAVVLVTDLPSAITMSKTATPKALDEPGGDVTFAIRVDNHSSADAVTIETLGDDVFGDLDGKGSCSVPQAIPPGGHYSCSFTEAVTGNGFAVHTNTATASGTDDDGEDVAASDDETVNLADVPPAASLTKAATALVVTFSVEVRNESAAEALTLDALVDDQFGDVTQAGGAILRTDCSVPRAIPVAGSYRCSFDATVDTSPHTDTVTGTVSDDEQNAVQPSDSATVSFE